MSDRIPTSTVTRVLFFLVFFGVVGAGIFLFGRSAEPILIENERGEERVESTDEEKEEVPEVTEEEKEIGNEEEQSEDIEEEEPREITLKQVVYEFLGRPYLRGPLGEKEGERIYREDVFDCTTLVLVSASKYNANDKSAEEMMKIANYYPAGVVSFESRLHFTTYRNIVSPLFEDVTHEVGGDLAESKRVLLNKKRSGEGRLIDIDWEEEVDLRYIKKEDVPRIVSELPQEAGVVFIVDGDEEIGLDIRHEGFVFDGKTLVHASSQRGEVSEENLLNFLQNSNYDGVGFFRVVRN